MDEARFIADKLVWQRFCVNEVFWTGPFGVNMLYTIANHFEYVHMITITRCLSTSNRGQSHVGKRTGSRCGGST